MSGSSGSQIPIARRQISVSFFVSSGATRWNDPKQFPWTVGFNPTYELEGRLYAKYILKTKPDAKIAVITPNEDAGKDYLRGFKDGLGEHVGQIVAETTYLTTDPTIDSQMVTMRESGADVFFNVSGPKFTPDGKYLRGFGEAGTKPGQFYAPHGIAMDSHGNLYVVDAYNHRIQKFAVE